MWDALVLAEPFIYKVGQYTNLEKSFPMAKKLFVGNLPYSVTGDKLNEMFSAHGKVASATLISDKFSGRSKGFGFVEMEDDNEADAAMKALNESELEGRKMIVNEARPMTDRPPRRDGAGVGGFQRRERRYDA